MYSNDYYLLLNVFLINYYTLLNVFLLQNMKNPVNNAIFEFFHMGANFAPIFILLEHKNLNCLSLIAVN